jgi:hypothetical protein
LRDSVGGLVYPLNAFWENTLESPNNEFFVVNILAGYLGEKVRWCIITILSTSLPLQQQQ